MGCDLGEQTVIYVGLTYRWWRASMSKTYSLINSAAVILLWQMLSEWIAVYLILRNTDQKNLKIG